MNNKINIFTKNEINQGVMQYEKKRTAVNNDYNSFNDNQSLCLFRRKIQSCK